MEVFPEVRAIIDLDIFKDKDKENEALTIIRSGKAFKKCQNGVNRYEVSDSFEKIDEIHTQLLKLRSRPTGAKISKSSGAESVRSFGTDSARSFGAESIRSSGAESTRSSDVRSSRAESTTSSGSGSARSSGAKSSGTESAAFPGAESFVSSRAITSASLNSPNYDFSVPVDKTILNYIEVIYGRELQIIEKKFDVLKRTSVKNTVTVEFVQNKSHLPCPEAADAFTSLYQSIATNLTLKSVAFSSLDKAPKKDFEAILQNKFPKVLVTFKDTGLDLIGHPSEVKNAESALHSITCHDYNFKSSQVDNRAVPDSKDSSRRSPLTPECKPNSNSAAARSKLESKDEDTTCPICLDEIEDRETLKKCKHSFCKECIKVAFKTKSACPICGEVYGEIRGNQPDGSRMTFRNLSIRLPGYENYDTIEIYYTIPDGTQGVEHPRPGQRYYGTVRTAYLPDNPEGRKVLKLLQRAFDQRLIFTVGTSSTTGRSDVVTWNDIHHKTSTTGGPSMFGYPDPTYLARVQDELKAKGIH